MELVPAFVVVVVDGAVFALEVELAVEFEVVVGELFVDPVESVVDVVVPDEEAVVAPLAVESATTGGTGAVTGLAGMRESRKS